MLENALFFGKKLEKSPQRCGLRPQTLLASVGWDSASDLQVVAPVTCFYDLKIMTYSAISVSGPP